MKLPIDPKVDYAFKHVFGREESKPILINLLDAVFQPAPGRRIATVDLLNPFNDAERPGGKTTVLDIKARDETGRHFNIEMQMLAYGAFRQRALYYWAQLHQGQLTKGKDFRVLRPTIAVCFVDTPLFPELPDYHLVYELRERRHATLFTDQMALHILELSKFVKTADELTTTLDRWLYFLRHATSLDIESLPEPLDVAEIRWALGDLTMISQNELERERYESHLKMQRDIYTALAEKLDEGRAEGEAKALIQRVQSLRRLLRQTETVEDLTVMSLRELERLAIQLEEQLEARLKLAGDGHR